MHPGCVQGCLDFKGQVLKPSSGYRGQKLTNPVSKGTTPSQPHHPTVPVAAKAIKTMPTMHISAIVDAGNSVIVDGVSV